ncbi:nuclear transport factor 2 family protein [Herminiimonas glaciei]|uniref:Nuclear transport factor 2 family protein n=1 Tax=Herminiimonas glaciei TaxID=523788 RepID=A0ABW2I8F2_9BURK
MIPQPIAAYVLAENSHDIDSVTKCFTQDAVVKDEGKFHRGRDQIRAWKLETASKYSAYIAPIQVTSNDKAYVLKASVYGNFPGSPAVLHFHFLTVGDLINSLEVTV